MNFFNKNQTILFCGADTQNKRDLIKYALKNGTRTFSTAASHETPIHEKDAKSGSKKWNTSIPVTYIPGETDKKEILSAIPDPGQKPQIIFCASTTSADHKNPEAKKDNIRDFLGSWSGIFSILADRKNYSDTNPHITVIADPTTPPAITLILFFALTGIREIALEAGRDIETTFLWRPSLIFNPIPYPGHTKRMVFYSGDTTRKRWEVTQAPHSQELAEKSQERLCRIFPEIRRDTQPLNMIIKSLNEIDSITRMRISQKIRSRNT